MERITLYLRTTKMSGKIKLRFRLIEGREVQLFHKSQIDADLADLKKFEMDGSLKPRVSIYNEKLRIAITREIEAMREAYNLLKDEGRVFDANDFEEMIDKILNPEKYNIVKVEEVETLLDRFNRYIDGLKTYGTVSEGRAKYIVSSGINFRVSLLFSRKPNILRSSLPRRIYWHSVSSLSMNTNM